MCSARPRCSSAVHERFYGPCESCRGDLGSNVGHIKEFYETLEPKMDEVYKEEQDKQNAKKPPQP